MVRRSREAGVQAMVEGPGHIPLDEVQMNMEKQAELCDGAPFYILGPVVIDCAPGYDPSTNNATGFMVFPTGAVDLFNDFVNFGTSGYWWTSTEGGDAYAWFEFLYFDWPNHLLIHNYKELGLGVRCIKDIE